MTTDFGFPHHRRLIGRQMLGNEKMLPNLPGFFIHRAIIQLVTIAEAQLAWFLIEASSLEQGVATEHGATCVMLDI